MSNEGPDYDHMRNVIVLQMEKLARSEATSHSKELEFGKMIGFLNEMHCTAVTSLAGAVLFTSAMKGNEDRREEMMEAVRNLVESTDANFSVSLRNMILTMSISQGLPNPFAIPKETTKRH